jgi:thiamine biosynthesis lipoprotein
MDVRFSFIKIMCLLLVTLHASAEWREYEHVAMTTPIKLVFWELHKQKSLVISKQVFQEFDTIEQRMSRYIEDSELSTVNKIAAKQKVMLSSELFEVLSAAMNISSLSEGAFDITFASVGYLYDFRQKLQPSDEAIKNGMRSVNYQHVHLDHKYQSVRFNEDGVMLDLGGIAKGYAVDQGIRILQDHGIKHAHLSAGGDMRLLGDKMGKPWIIGIRNPRVEDKQSLIMPLSDTAISTSGDYERFFIDDAGERIHHILSPQTGKPVKGLQSVTVLAADATTSDGLSTAIFVLGLEKGLALVNRLSGIEAVIIDEPGKVHYSEGLMQPE